MSRWRPALFIAAILAVRRSRLARSSRGTGRAAHAVGLYRRRRLVPRRAGRRHGRHRIGGRGHARHGGTATVRHRSCDAHARRASRRRPMSPQRRRRSRQPRPTFARPMPKPPRRRPTPAKRAATSPACCRSRKDDAAAVAGKDIDAARAALGSAQARVAAARRTADARRAQVAAARAQAEEATGRPARGGDPGKASSPPWRPAPARVEEVFFQPGEWVAGQPAGRLAAARRQGQAALLRARARGRALPRRAARSRFTCDGCAAGPQRHASATSARSPEFTPPVIYSRDARDRLVFMVEAVPAAPGEPAAGPAGRRRAAADDPRHRRPRASASASAASTSVERRRDPGRAGPHLRLPRPQRLGQDDDAADAVRAADARQRRRAGARPRLRARARRDQAPDRLHDPALLALRGPDDRGEPRVHRARLRPRPDRSERVDRDAREARPRRPPQAAGRQRCRAAGSSASRWPPR